MILKERIIERAIRGTAVAILFIVMGIYHEVHGQSNIKMDATLKPSIKQQQINSGQPNAKMDAVQKPSFKLQQINSGQLNAKMDAVQKITISKFIPAGAKATPLHHAINSPYEEIKPVYALDGNRLYFARVSDPENTAGVEDPEDIWYAHMDTTDGSWSEPIRMSNFFNNAGPNSINCVGITGDTIVLNNQYLRKGKMRGGLSYSINEDGEWSVPQPIRIKNEYDISDDANYFVSLKTGVIISAVQRDETVGLRDLYVSFWDGEHATEPVNMGMEINSDLDESSPFLAADNKTLYFASKGHSGFGGYDIFVTKRLDNSWTNWSRPENLGPAVNGELDEEFFSLAPDGQYAIFSKVVGIENSDLYKIAINEKAKEMTPVDKLALSGL